MPALEECLATEILPEARPEWLALLKLECPQPSSFTLGLNKQPAPQSSLLKAACELVLMDHKGYFHVPF
jgi:hypothetical protein